MSATLETLEVQFKATNTSNAIKNITMMAQAVRRLADSLKGLDASRFGEFASGMSQIANNIPNGTQANNMNRFAEGVERLASAISGTDISGFANGFATMGQSMGSGASGMNSFVSTLRDVSQQATATANAIQTATQAMSTDMSSRSPVDASSQNTTGAWVSDLETVQVKLTGIKGVFQQMGMLVPTKQFDKLKDSAENVRKKYDELKESMRQALRGGEMTAGSDEFTKKSAELTALRTEYDKLIQKQKELALSGEGFQINPRISGTLSNIKNGFQSVSHTIKSASSFVDRFTSKLRSLATASKRAKKDTSSLTDTVKGMVKELTRVSKMLKLMVTRMALRAVIKEVGNGFKSLALHSEAFNQSMSNLINGSKQLGYSFAGMVEPLINALAPALLYIIELAMKAVNAINQLLSAISGAAVWHRAKAFTDSWADSINDASGKAKELKKTVLGFDELNQLQDNKNSGGGGNAITDMFEDVPVDPWFKNLADKIKNIAAKLFEPIKNAWEKVGKWVKEKWKYALDEVLKLGKSFGRDFLKMWAQPETEQIFKNIFIIVGEIGRTVGNLARQFRIAWDEGETGLHILEAIRNIVLIITDHLRRMATATADWAAQLNFKPLLTALQGWLESLEPAIDAVMGVIEDFYTEVVLKFSKWVIESGLPALIDVFKRFNEKVDWEKLRKNLKQLWEHLEPFMETVGEGLILFIERVSDAIANFINSEKFENFLENIEAWMDSVTPEQVADGIETLVKALIGLKILSVINGLVTGFTSALGGLAPVVWTAAAALAGAEIGKKLGEWLFPNDKELYEKYKGISGTFQLIKDTSKTIAEEIYYHHQDVSNRVSATSEAVKATWGGIKSAAEGLAQGIANSNQNVNASFDNMAKAVGEGAKKIDGWWTDAANAMGNAVNKMKTHNNGLSAVWQSAQSTMNTFKTNSMTTLNAIKDGFVKCFEGIKTGIKTPINAIIGFVEKLVNGLIDGVNKMSSALGSLSVDIPDWVPEIGGNKFELKIPKLNHISIPKLANGGMLNEDGFFFANHNELIGGFGNGRTAVTNNEQILRSIENGVYNATVRANTTSGGNEKYIVTEINVDGERLATAVSRGQSKADRRFNPSMA